MKRVLWVRSVGKGSKVGDVKGLVLGSGEADKSAEKNNGHKWSDGPMGVECWKFFKIFGRRANGKRRMVWELRGEGV